MKTKICTKCKVEKPIIEFYKRNDSNDGYRNECKKCVRDKSKKWRENNPEKYKELNINWAKNKSERERQENKDKTGVELKGIRVLNPLNNEELPVWVADYFF